MLAGLVVTLATIGSGTYAAWGWITSPFKDEPRPSMQSGELSLHSYFPDLVLSTYLENHPEAEQSEYSDEELGSLGVQVRVTIHLVGYRDREVLIRVSDPHNGFLGATTSFESPTDDYRGEVDHWAPYGEEAAQAYIELVDKDHILESLKTKLFEAPFFAFPPGAPPQELLPPLIVEQP